MDINSQLSQFFGAEERSQTLIFCRPFPTIDACVLCGSHSYSELSPEEIIASKEFVEDYKTTFTWEHWGDEKHQWELVGYHSFSGDGQLFKYVMVFYYSPIDEKYIHAWMGVEEEEQG